MSEKWLNDVTPLMVSKCSHEMTGLNYSILLDKKDIWQAANEMIRREYHLEDISAADFAEGYLLTYHFGRFSNGDRIALRIIASHDDPDVPTISNVYQGADWHERECFDFYGINFSGHKNLIPLLLASDAENGVLRKDESARKTILQLTSSGETVFKKDGFELSTESEAETADA